MSRSHLFSSPTPAATPTANQSLWSAPPSSLSTRYSTTVQARKSKVLVESRCPRNITEEAAREAAARTCALGPPPSSRAASPARTTRATMARAEAILSPLGVSPNRAAEARPISGVSGGWSSKPKARCLPAWMK